MVKKILSVVLSTIMVFGMTTLAFAANEMTASNMPGTPTVFDIASYTPTGQQEGELPGGYNVTALDSVSGMSYYLARLRTSIASATTHVAGAIKTTDPENVNNSVLAFAPNFSPACWTAADDALAAASEDTVDGNTDAYTVTGYSSQENDATVECYVYKEVDANGCAMKKWKRKDNSATGNLFFRGEYPACFSVSPTNSYFSLGKASVAETGTAFFGFSFYKEGNGSNLLDNDRIMLQLKSGSTTIQTIYIDKNGLFSTGSGDKAYYYVTDDYTGVYEAGLRTNNTYIADSADKVGVFNNTDGLTKFNISSDAWHDVLLVCSADAKVMRIYIDGKPVFVKVHEKEIYTSEFVLNSTSSDIELQLGVAGIMYFAGADTFVDNLSRGTSAAAIVKNKDIAITETKLANTDGKDSYSGVAIEVIFPRAEQIEKIKWVIETEEGRFYSDTMDCLKDVTVEGAVRFGAVMKNGTVVDGTSIVDDKVITGVDAIFGTVGTNYFTNIIDAHNMSAE